MNEFKYPLEMYRKAKSWHKGDTMRQSRNTAQGRRTTVDEEVTTFEIVTQEEPLLFRKLCLNHEVTYVEWNFKNQTSKNN
jgi:hypothetical protein